MANHKYRSLKIKFLRLGRKRQWFYYFWLFKNNKKCKLIGRYFPHHFRIEDQFIKVSIVNSLALNKSIQQGAVFKPKVAQLIQGFL